MRSGVVMPPDSDRWHAVPGALVLWLTASGAARSAAPTVHRPNHSLSRSVSNARFARAYSGPVPTMRTEGFGRA
jgi:hypothetical protein